MKVTLMVAMGRNRAIGKDNALPWRLPADLRQFKAITTGHPIIMGRKTYESIGRPLPGRTNIVITRQEGLDAPGCLLAGSIEDALARAPETDEVFVIGGASIYRAALALADRLRVTLIDRDFEADAYFPEIDLKRWIEVESRSFPPDAQNPYSYAFLTYERVRSL